MLLPQAQVAEDALYDVGFMNGTSARGDVPGTGIRPGPGDARDLARQSCRISSGHALRGAYRHDADHDALLPTGSTVGRALTSRGLALVQR